MPCITILVLLLSLPCYTYDAILILTLGYPLYANQLLGLRPSHNPSLTEKKENRDETIKVVITT